MPKIDADTLAEHVEQQQQRVFEAAVSLFVERGYEQVTFGEIAERVGLARNSLYRYYPGKAAILAKWIERELDASIERSEEILDGPGTLEELIANWVRDQISYSRRPEHALLVSFASARGDLDDETLARLQQSHARLSRTLTSALESSGKTENPELVASLIQGLVNQASSEPADRDPESLELVDKAVVALLGG